MSGSLSVAVRKAVTAGLAAHFSGLASFSEQADDQEVSVTYAYQPSNKAAQQVYAARSRGEHGAVLRSGRNHRPEEATFDLIVRVKYVGGSIEEADERAFEIGAAVEEWVADRKSNELGVDGLNWLRVESWEADNNTDDSSSASLLIYTVRWNARLT